MLTLTSDAGQTWHLTDEQASNFATLVTLPPDVLASLVDLARAQAKLDAATGNRSRPSLRVVDDRGAIVHRFDCRHGRLHATRGEPVPVCRWVKDPAGGYACAECGTWAKPDSERARVLDGLAIKPVPTPYNGEDLWPEIDEETEALLFEGSTLVGDPAGPEVAP